MAITTESLVKVRLCYERFWHEQTVKNVTEVVAISGDHFCNVGAFEAVPLGCGG